MCVCVQLQLPEEKMMYFSILTSVGSSSIVISVLI